MPNSDLDEIDLRILSMLQQDGRITNQNLSDAVGLSPSPCLRRLRALEAKGVITGYVALIDPEKVGLPVTAFVRVRLDRQDDRHLAEFEAAVTAFPEVMECYLMTGNRDYLLRVVTADLPSYENFIKTKLTRLDGIASIESSFALSQVKYSIALPV